MEQSFWDKLKRVKFSDLGHFFKLLLALPIAFFVRRKRKHLWLLCDTRYEAGDNAYWLFAYISRHQPETDAVFALDKKSRDYEKVRSLGKIVQYGSLKHWVYYLAAEKNISSQKMGKPNAAICYLLEVYGIIKNKRAFLQHGVITADLTFLHYPHTRMSLFVCSTYREWKFVRDVYEYPAGVVQQLGLCRFDGLHHFDVKKGQVLVMPTWRMYIRNQISNKNKEKAQDEFKKTAYFRHWDGLLNNTGFLKLLEDYKLEVVFYPHREMNSFLDCFTFSSRHIRIASWKEQDVQSLLKESAVLITDYSSVAMDFAYMKKPLIYYQFDYEEFRCNHHPEGDFSFEQDGFGPVVRSVDEVVDTLGGMCVRDFQNEKEYLARHEQYFDLYDDCNCERNYNAICQM